MDFKLAPIIIGVAIGGLVIAGAKPVMRMTSRAGRAIANGADRMTAGVREAWNEGIQEAMQDRDRRAAARAARA